MSPAERTTSGAGRGTVPSAEAPGPASAGSLHPAEARRGTSWSPDPPGAARPRATKVGTVVSDRMKKTIVVEVERRVQEARYQRTIRRTSRFMAHDEENAAKVGDRVRIEETRPLSRRKRWRLREILRREEA